MATIATLVALISSPATAQTYEGALRQRFFTLTQSSDVFQAQLRYPEATSTDPSTHTSYQLGILGSVSGRPTDIVGLRFGIDSGLLDISSEGLRIDGGSAQDRAQQTLFLGESWVDVQLGPSGVLEVKLGKLRPRVGHGLVFDAYAWGLSVDVDLTLPDIAPTAFRFLAIFPSGQLVQETFQRPLFEARARIELSGSTNLSIFTAVHLDNDGLAPILTQTLVQGRFEALVADLDRRIETETGVRREILIAFRDQAVSTGAQTINAGDLRYRGESRGWLGWSGLTITTQHRSLHLEAEALAGYGKLRTEFIPTETYRSAVANLIDQVRDRFVLSGRQRLVDGIDAFVEGGGIDDILSRQERRAHLALLSGLARLRLRYRLNGVGEFDAFLLAQSGDGPLPAEVSDESTYGAFISLAPLFDATSIFFNGGLASTVASPTVASLAPDNAGLIAAGAGARALLSDCCSAYLRGALMSATVESNATGSSFFGAEINLIADALLGDNKRPWLPRQVG